MPGVVTAVVGRRIAVFLIQNALPFIGNQLYDLLCYQIAYAASSRSFWEIKKKNPFSYSLVTDYTISNSQAPELSIQTVKYVVPDTSNTIVGVGWQFRLVIESPYKYSSDYSGVVSFETDWGSSQKGFTSYRCVKQQYSSATSYSIAQPAQTNEYDSSACTGIACPAYDSSYPAIKAGSSGSFNYQPGSSTNLNNVGLTGNLNGKPLSTGNQLFDFSCDGLRLDNFLISIPQNNGGATFTQYGYAPLKIGGQFSFVARIQIQIPTQSIPIFSKNLSSIYMILDAATWLILSCVAAALIVLAF